MNDGDDETERIVPRVHVEAGTVGSIAQGQIDDAPHNHDAEVRRQSYQTSPPGSLVEKYGVRHQICDHDQGGLAGKQAYAEKHGTEKGRPAIAPLAPAVVKEKRRQRERERDERVAIGEPTDGRPARIIERVEKERQPGVPAFRKDAPVHHPGHHHERAVPDEAVHMHEVRMFGEELVIEPMRERRQRPKEREERVRIGPPREHAFVHQRVVRGRVAGREAERVERPVREPGHAGLFAEHQLVE